VTVKYARGSDLGGGVCGILYTMRPVSGVLTVNMVKGGRIILKGLPIVAGAVTVGAVIAEGKTSNEIGADVLMQASCADMLQYAAEEISAPAVRAIEQNRQRYNEVEKAFWNGGMDYEGPHQ
jgi:hypothetical protein